MRVQDSGPSRGSIRVTSSESRWAAPGPADCRYYPGRATRTTSPPPQIVGCRYVAANAFRCRGMNQRGVSSVEAQQVGRTESLLSKSPSAPPLPGIGPRHSGGPDGPTAKGFVNTGPKFPFTVDVEDVVRKPTCLAQRPNTCGEDVRRGADTHTQRRPARSRSAS